MNIEQGFPAPPTDTLNQSSCHEIAPVCLKTHPLSVNAFIILAIFLQSSETIKQKQPQGSTKRMTMTACWGKAGRRQVAIHEPPTHPKQNETNRSIQGERTPASFCVLEEKKTFFSSWVISILPKTMEGAYLFHCDVGLHAGAPGCEASASFPSETDRSSSRIAARGRFYATL